MTNQYGGSEDHHTSGLVDSKEQEFLLRISIFFLILSQKDQRHQGVLQIVIRFWNFLKFAHLLPL